MINKNQRSRLKTKTRRIGIELLETRRLLTASLGWDGPGLGAAEITYHIANTPKTLSKAQTTAAIETALAAWSSVADITFTPTNQSGLRDSIDISFTNIDGPGGTLAQAYFPDDVNPARIAGDIQIDSSDAWEVGNSLGNRAFDLVRVAVHEIGHSLGLDHLSNASSLLAPYVSPSQSFTALPAIDASSIQRLYAAADSTTTTTNPSPTSTDAIPTVNPADTGDSDYNPFPRTRWYFIGNWHRFGGRLMADTPEHFNFYKPTDVNGDDLTTALDALMVINVLNSSSPSDNISGKCDTNGDGSITALDALIVINWLNSTDVLAKESTLAVASGGTQTSNTLEPIDQFDDTVLPVDGVDDTGTPVDEVDDTVDPVDEVDDTGTPVDEVDDTGTPVDEGDDTGTPVDEGDDTGTPVDEIDDTGTPIDEVDDTVDPVDEVDDTVDPVDEVDDTVDPVDEGAETTDDHNCGDGALGRHGIPLLGGFIHGNIDRFFTHFDVNSDGGLTKDEVPAVLWEKLVAKNVDANSNAVITLDEINAAISAAQAAKFLEKDANSDGVLSEDEVSERIWAKLASADTNADGGVSLAEFNAWLAARPTDAPSDRPHGHDHHHPIDALVDQSINGHARGGILRARR